MCVPYCNENKTDVCLFVVPYCSLNRNLRFQLCLISASAIRYIVVGNSKPCMSSIIEKNEITVQMESVSVADIIFL